jgi:hypothetical protein
MFTYFVNILVDIFVNFHILNRKHDNKTFRVCATKKRPELSNKGVKTGK